MEVEELHLVRRGANNFPLLLMKSTDQALAEAAKEIGATTPKGKHVTKKLSKLLKEQSIHSLNMAGASSTAPSQLSDAAASRLLDEATGQGRRPNGAAPRGAYGTAAIIKAMDKRVDRANKALTKAASDYERTAAKAEYESAARQRLVTKLIIQANTPGGTRFGGASKDLFGGSTLNLPDDSAVHGFSTGRPA